MMGKIEYGKGYNVSRLTVMLVSFVSFVWVICGVLLFITFIGGTDDNGDNVVMLIQEFYNSTEGDDACLSVPVIYENGILNEQSVLINSDCKAAHQEFRTMYPDVRALYVINTTYTYEEIFIDDDIIGISKIHAKIVAVDEHGNVIEGLSKIVIPLEERENPYYTGYNTTNVPENGDDKHSKNFPKYSEITYGVYDRGDS